MSEEPGILGRIVAARRRHLRREIARLPLPELRARALRVPMRGGFAAALKREAVGPLPVIAELKRASPSEGPIRADLRVEEVAAGLAAGGAVALSVLTEPDHFRGRGGDLARARYGAPGLPLLRKDFLIDPWQVWESRLLGADAALLIARLLPGSALLGLFDEIRAAELEAVVEIKDESELDLALDAGAGVIGVNARDLADFTVDLSRTERLAGKIPAGVLSIAESGVRGREDLRRLAAAGFSAALVGTALMREPKPGMTLSTWLAPPVRGVRW